MRKNRIVDRYRRMSAEDQQTYRRWLAGNGALASLMAGGIVVMAIMGAMNYDRGRTLEAGQAPFEQSRR
jgi:hypothetical protein